MRSKNKKKLDRLFYHKYIRKKIVFFANNWFSEIIVKKIKIE